MVMANAEIRTAVSQSVWRILFQIRISFIPSSIQSNNYTSWVLLVPLGSIPELPAETCSEIKMSEGHSISRKYWFSTIKTGTSVLAYCNMETEGEFSFKLLVITFASLIELELIVWTKKGRKEGEEDRRMFLRSA